MTLESGDGNGTVTNGVASHTGDASLAGKDTPQNGQASQPAYPKEFYEPYMSALSKTRLPSPIRGLLVLESIPGMLSMLAGKPSEQTFPITSISINVRSQTSPSEEITLKIDSEGGRLSEALQYGRTTGQTDLIAWLLAMQKHYHGRSEHPSWELSVGAGSQDLLYKAFLALNNPGDSVLIEAPVYAGVIPLFISSGVNMVEVATDGSGIDSSSLRSILESWPAGKPYPKYLYTVPYGCNPTGATASLERRRGVLALARKYKFLILEDDPYYLLYYGPEPRPASYFALEAQDGHGTGIVLRFDSLSKVVSSGLRIGFVSGPAPIVDAMRLHTASANLQPSSLAQSVTYVLLRHWGISGLDAHTKYVSQFYRERRDVFEATLKKHLGGLVEYTSPVSGMFLWFKLRIPPPANDPNGEGDSSELIRTKAFEKGVLALPGTVFFASGERSAYVRASFSMLDDEKTDEALRRLGEVVREARGEI